MEHVANDNVDFLRLPIALLFLMQNYVFYYEQQD